MTTEERIQKEAEEFIQSAPQMDRPFAHILKTGYIAGATIEAARNKENAVAFLKFREKHCDWVYDSGYNEWGWETDLPEYKGLYSYDDLYDLFIEQNKKI